jgi:putative glutamine amidotransferase
MPRPLIGLTADLENGAALLTRPYWNMVVEAGGIPIILPPVAALRGKMLDRIDGVIITGGYDIDVTQFGVPLHPLAECMHHERQSAEFAILDELAQRPQVPVLGICLGMQLMGVHRGNALIQHLGDVIPNADRHREGAEHRVDTVHHAPFASGMVRSYHHQALATANAFEILAHSDDGVIEAILDPQRKFCLGVQWHPERTPTPQTGLEIIRLLITASL